MHILPKESQTKQKKLANRKHVTEHEQKIVNLCAKLFLVLIFITCNCYTACLKTSLLSHLLCLNKVD